MIFRFDINNEGTWPNDIYGTIMRAVFSTTHPRLKEVGLNERKSWKNHRPRATIQTIFLPQNENMPPELLRSNKYTLQLKNVKEAYELKRIDNFCEITSIELSN